MSTRIVTIVEIVCDRCKCCKVDAETELGANVRAARAGWGLRMVDGAVIDAVCPACLWLACAAADPDTILAEAKTEPSPTARLLAEAVKDVREHGT